MPLPVYNVDPTVPESFEPSKRSPERSLLAALLSRAILDFFDKDELIRRSAKRWLFTENVKTPPLFTFDFVCEELEINGDRILDALITKKELNESVLLRFREY